MYLTVDPGSATPLFEQLVAGIRAQVIDGSLTQGERLPAARDLADSLDVWAVPRIVVNGVPQWDGAVPERVFLDRILAPAFE